MLLEVWRVNYRGHLLPVSALAAASPRTFGPIASPLKSGLVAGSRTTPECRGQGSWATGGAEETDGGRRPARRWRVRI